MIKLTNLIKADCAPPLGVLILEPEPRILNPKFIDHSSYREQRNSLIRKIKSKSEVNFLPLVKYGIQLDNDILKPDGVHLNSTGSTLLLTVLKTHIIRILFPNRPNFDTSDL